MKVNFIYLFIAVLSFLGLGLYTIDLKQDIVQSQEEKQEIIQQKIREEDIIQSQEEKQEIIQQKIREEDIIQSQEEKQEIIQQKIREVEEKKEKEIMALEEEISSLALDLKKLEQNISLLEKKKIDAEKQAKKLDALEAEIKKLLKEKTEMKKVIKTLPTRLEEKLEDPTWAELKQFLRDDKTNEIVFDDKTFDCSGFAITLFRNARAHGIRTAYVEVVFDGYGHALNKFKTTDKGYVFIDVTGNREGTGRDTVAYIKKGEPFGTIYIGAVKSSKIDCARITSCSHFINPLPTKRHSKLFDYSFFQDKLVCGDLFDKCLSELNDEIGRFNRRESNFTKYQLDSWRNNINLLGDQVSVDRKFVFTETPKKATNVEIYW